MNNLQIQATDPASSVWVSASAGTGKTKILTDRVLRLLIEGGAFNKILCLTFTNAAASEMDSRITTKLAQWASLSTQQLLEELSLMLSRVPTKAEISHAKTLYHNLLSTQDKINIHTIHSFCQKILKQFPLESGVSPAFQILDNIKELEVLKEIKNQLYLDEKNKELVNFFTANFHEVTINDILAEIIEQRIKFKNVKDVVLNLSSAPPIIPALGSRIHHTKIKPELLSIIDPSLCGDDKQLKSFFLTREGDKKQRVLSAKEAKANPDLKAELEELQELVYAQDQAARLEQMIYYSSQLNKLARVFIDLYESYKREYSLLDYDDLIYLTKSLLTSANAKEWVLYKLDGGIDHLLVDEAQDTSPQQWEIIEAIITEFYSGESSKRGNRTIFVVGDEKQSIFSFQGADVESFNLMHNHLKEKLASANKDFKVINLEWSYRSTKEVLEVVYNIFEKIKKNDPHLFKAGNPQILPFRHAHPGKVELWPLLTGEKNLKTFWPLPEDHDYSLSPQMELAIKIASFIKEQITSGVILPSTGKCAREADFMLLFRRRDEFTLEVINQLKNQGLEVAGIDRMTLNQNLSVADLISVAKFVLSPADDLNLASLLKSPLIGFSEEELYKVAASRGESSIWQALNFSPLSYHQAIKKLTDFIQLYQTTTLANFFHIIVDCLPYRGTLNAANGPESNDAINELLYLSHKHANKNDSSLQSFINWFEGSEIEVKRDTTSIDKIRVMTVHGSKGLQAPVVILCDTTSLPVNQSKFLWNENGELFATRGAQSAPGSLNLLKEKQQKEDLQEYLRLLYVGMTRVEDHLIICGYSPTGKLPQNCWYMVVQNSMQGIAKIADNGVMIYESSLKNLLSAVPRENALGNKLPEFIPYESCYKLPKIESNGAPTSPLISPDYLEYGRIFHKILEDCIKIKDLNALIAHPLIGTLSPGWQSKIRQSISKLLANDEFADLMKAEIKTEVNIGVAQGYGIKTGRIDLLVIKENQLIIIDYKSDSLPPENEQSIPISYIQQLNFYRQTMQKLYPKHQIICQILWLQTGKFNVL